MKNMKRGVSLITVLLFMLVATIAATATYKWLTSESRSSASRLMQAEAKESAVSGIEAARSWMTYHANDVGAIIKQFFSNEKKPVSLDGVLPDINHGQQRFSVSVVAVDVSTNVYKMKIVSTGTSKGGAKHTEAAIMKVSGLYRVMVPTVNDEVDVDLNYNFAYYGGSTTMGTNSKADAMLVNGDLTGSQITIENDAIITGDLSSSQTNHLKLGANTCVRKNLIISNQGLDSAHNIYVGENVNSFSISSNGHKKITGDAYFNGNVGVSSLGAGITILGNVSLRGTWTGNSTAKKTHIGGNMCLLANTSKVNFRTPSNENQGVFVLDGSMWVPSERGLEGNKVSPSGNYAYVQLGTTANSQLYIKNVNLCNEKYRSFMNLYLTPTTYYYDDHMGYWSLNQATGDCPKTDGKYTHYFQAHTSSQYHLKYSCTAGVNDCEQDATRIYTTDYTAFTSSAPEDNLHANVSGEPTIACADDIYSYCDNYFKNLNNCPGDPGKKAVPDILKTDSSYGAERYQTECVADVLKKTFAELKDGQGVAELNTCEQTVPASKKYGKGDNLYLVVRATPEKLGYIFTDPATKFNGKFIIFVDGEGLTGKVPGTTETSEVFMYLPYGSGELTPYSSHDLFRYFIFSDADISSLGNGSTGMWKGSFYMKSENCAKVPGGLTDKQTMEYDPEMANHLAAVGVICPVSASSCGDGEAASSSSIVIDDEVVFDGGYDSYHIATGAQLHIEVESEYANTESVSNPDPVEQSIVVLPRIVYLNEDAVGKLTDYFSAMPLNGASVEGTGTTSCEGGLSASLAFSSQPAVMRKGKSYVCTYTEGSYRSYFFVAVTGGASTDARVSFESPASVYITPTSSSSSTVNLLIPAISGAESENIKVEINVMDDGLTGWTISKIAATTNLEEKPGSNGRVYVYTGTASSVAQTVPLFTVHTNAGAQAGSVIFALQSPEGCSIVGNATKTYSITGSATIKRESIARYCETYPDNCTGANSKYATAANEEDCGDLGPAIWIEAWPNCTTEEGMANEQWKCPSGNSSNNPIQLRALSYDDSKCVLYKPDLNNSIVGAKDDSENPNKPYILYASLKKRSFGLHLEKEGATDSKMEVYTKTSPEAEYESFNVCNNVSCDYSIVVGTYVKVVANATGDDAFNYWSCQSSNCDWVNNVSPTIEFVMGSAQSYKAHFNERDDHCFYSALDTMTIACASVSSPETNRHCIDECDNSSTCNVGRGEYGDNAKWLRVASSAGTPVPSTDAGFLGNHQQGKISFIMHHNVAGPNGMLTARIKTAKVSAGHEDDMLNDGFVVRSNKTVGEYLMVNIYGKMNAAYARVCLASGLSTSSSKCLERRLENAGHNSFTVNPMEPINIKLTLSRSNLSVTAKGAYSHTFNLASDWTNGTLNDPEHQYVGFKVSNPEFQIHDIGWKTDEFSNAACFEYPSISCSFAAKYLGSQVELRKKVEPWVGYSSWFTNSGNCSIDAYYYNGCDMPSSYFVNQWSGDLEGSCTQGTDGYYKNVNNAKDGLKLTSENKFFFEDEGLHGYLHNDGNGYVKNGSVKASCPNTDNTSIDLFANCGRFFVGDLKKCSKNAAIFVGSEYVSGERSFTQANAIFNLRDAELNFDFEDLSDAADIQVVLIDENGVESPARYISNSTTSIPISEFLNKYGFNPEKVKTVRLQGTSGFTLKAISSTCPYAIGMNCNNVSVEFNNGWVITAPISNVSNAKHCKITANSSDIAVPATFVSCNESGVFTVPDNEENPFEELLHRGAGGLQYTFTVGAYEDEDAEYEDAPTVSCPVTTPKYDKMTMKCSIPEDAKTVIQGLGVPTLTYSFENCPSTGCYYSVSLTSDITEVGYGNGKTPVTGGTWKPEVNTKSDRLTTGTYSYTVKATNSTGGEYASCTTDEFEVLAAVEATASCSISGNTLSISARSSNYESVTMQLVETDPLGNPFWTRGLAANGPELDTTLDLNRDVFVLEGGMVVLSILYGDSSKSCGTYIRPEGDPTGTCYFDKQSIYSNQTAVFSDTGVTHCDSWALMKEGETDTIASSDECGTSITVPDLGPGAYNLYYNGSATAYCSRTVTARQNVSLTCDEDLSIDATTTAVTIPYNKFTVTNCDGCTYAVAATTTGAGVSDNTGTYSSGDISFNATGSPSGEIDYTLTMTDSSGTSSDCEFSVVYSSSGTSPCIAFVNGVYGYNEHCYNSGLEEMAEDKCYTMNPDRVPDGVPQWINNKASDTHWWVETNCDGSGISGGGTSSATITSSASSFGACIAFVNGVYGYNEHCYNSGLEEMAEGKCYTMNPARVPDGVPQWINNKASDTHWWVETTCISD